MNMNSLFTLQTGTFQIGQPSPAATGQPKLDSAQSLDFMALILSRLGQSTPAGLTKTINPGAPAAGTPEITPGETPADDALLETLSLNREALDSVLAPLTKGIITSSEVSNGSPRILKALLIDTGNPGSDFSLKINKLKSELQKLMKSGDAVAISVNLTPEQITALQNAKDGEWPKELAGMMIGIVTLAPPRNAAAPENAAQPAPETDPEMQNLLVMLVPAPMAESQKVSQSLAPGLAPASGKAPQQTTGPQNTAGGPAPDAGTSPDGQAPDFETTLQDFQIGSGYRKNSELAATANAPSSSTPSAKGLEIAHATPYGNALQNWPFAPESGLHAAAPADFLADGQPGLALGLESPALRMASLTGLITQAHSAGHTHPATQAVAISLQKAASQNENRTFVLEMDPPELGRVEVRLAFGRDKTVKTTVITEKPETYMMLQRDSHALERALENAGLDSGGGLSFELAGHGQDFSDGNQRGGGHDAGSTGAGGNESEETITSTMTWHVDPATGYTRYDILA